MRKRMDRPLTNPGTGLQGRSPLEGEYCQETTELVCRRAIESQVVAYMPAFGCLGQVTYQCCDSLEDHWNIPYTKLGSCSQG